MGDNEFGYTAWGMDWVRLAEPLHRTRPEPLLPRARSIARHHGVDLTVTGRIVRAHIQRGGQASLAHLEVEPMSRATVAAVAEVLPDPGHPTDEAHRALLEVGLSPAPVLVGTDCSCPARKAHCLHVLATLYAVARRVDENPRLALELRGYFDSALRAADPETPAPRWIPLHTLDPEDYFHPAGPPLPVR
ncbi:MAG TPA: SWIM zinc finger family protein [Nocardia sp.]|uniref:SWIM zinc finger family protein n=1 Tax=Nocardia TaxID=1817 RepID=UPI0024570FA2|nr:MULTISPECIES: SWIM zinc finger family protein [Nocardia]HLS78106.1 SWIM zinc finger family protein [Nocardia sp.]